MSPTSIAVLQRRCHCGGVVGPTGECAACRSKRLHRQARPGAGPALAPPIVHEVLRSPGRPLDNATRAYMEPRFGHDFSRVRVHADSRAAESAQSVDALAYTVGSNVVFAAGQFRPATSQGRGLLAHELAHVIQQQGTGALSGRIAISESAEPAEREADIVATSVGTDPVLPAMRRSPPVVQRQAKPTTPTTARRSAPSCTPRTGNTEYGCYCGAGSSCGSGLTCAPTDDLDACCQQHDINYLSCSFIDRYNQYSPCYWITMVADSELCDCAHRLAGRFSGATERYRLLVLTTFCRFWELGSAAGAPGTAPTGGAPESAHTPTPTAVA